MLPDENILRAALDAVDVGMALVGADGRIEYANAAFGEFVAHPATAVEGASVFGTGCPCEALKQHEPEWAERESILVSGECPQGSTVDVMVRPVTAGSDMRLVVVRRGLIRAFPHRRLPDEVIEDLQAFLTELTGHSTDPAALAAAPLSILMLGVDDVDGLRESYGDPVVEEVLRQVAQALVLQKRKADIISRYGDGQFLVLAPDTPRYGAAMLAERIRQRVESLEFEANGRPVPISLVTWAAEYRSQLDGSIREAVERASESVAGRTPETIS